MPSEDIVSAYWTTRPWCCVVASIHAPPRCRLSALPNELTQHFVWCPCEESNPALPLTRRLHRRQCFKGGASRRNQTSVSSLRGACSVTELCRHPRFIKIDKWTGVLLRIPKPGGSCTMPRPIHLDVHDVKQLDPCGSHFQSQAKLRRAPCARARGRVNDADHAPASHAQHERRHDWVVFLAMFWAVLVLLPVWRRVFWPCRRLVRSC